MMIALVLAVGHRHHGHHTDLPLPLDIILIGLGLGALIYLTDLFFRLVWTLLTASLPRIAQQRGARWSFVMARLLAILVLADQAYRLCVLVPTNADRGITEPIFALCTIALLWQAQSVIMLVRRPIDHGQAQETS